MSEEEDALDRKAEEELMEVLGGSDVEDPVVIHAESETEWDPTTLVSFSEHELHVLDRSGDIAVFFDSDGRVLGWRDDARQGMDRPSMVDRTAFLEAVSDELDLPETTRLGSLEPRELPPVGWTYEAVLFLKRVPEPRDILRVWVSPQSLRVIQCLFDESPEGGEGP